MHRRVCLPVLVAGALFFVVSCSRSPRTAADLSSEIPPHAVAEFPEQIDLGKRERGEIAVAAFKMANRGGADLVIDQFESNCSCSGIERKKDNEVVRVEALRIKPGEEVELMMRISVRGMPVGAAARNGVRFRTNDPDKPSGRIEGVITRVTGGVFTVPESVVVGTVRHGTKVRHVLHVRDDALAPRVVKRVTSSQDRVAVRILDASEETPTLSGPHGGVSIAVIEVVVDTSKPGNIDSTLTLDLAGEDRKPEQVRILGRVLAPIELSPSTLVLPRSAPGEIVYNANCLIRSNDSNSVSVSIDSCPEYLTVKIPSGDGSPSPSKVLTVSLDPKSPALATSPHNQPVRIRCRSGDTETIVELHVIVMP